MATRLFLNPFRSTLSSGNIVRNLSKQALMDTRATSAASGALASTNPVCAMRSVVLKDKVKVAEELCDAGLEHLDSQEYKKALTLFRRAHAMNPNPSYEHFMNMAESNGSFPSF